MSNILELENLASNNLDLVESLLREFKECKDQNQQAQIVSKLANIGDDRALELLVTMVGVEIANHCQGNVRRVAARGLGKMVRENTLFSQVLKAVDKLSWAMLNTEDWALRYASALSLDEIFQRNINSEINIKIKNDFDLALSKESDQVVLERIKRLNN
jgi:phycoerythrocyanin alpha-cysteine-84 phycoviolobilin lyase/isomerase subunit PecF